MYYLPPGAGEQKEPQRFDAMIWLKVDKQTQEANLKEEPSRVYEKL